MLLENYTYPQDGRVRREALALTRAGLSVTVICPKAPGQPWYEVIDGVCAVRYWLPSFSGGALGYLAEYSYAMTATFLLSCYVLVRHGFDVIHAHNPPDLFVVIALFFRLFGKRFLFDQHDLSPEKYCARFGREGGWLYRALMFFERLSCRSAHRVIVTNESYRAVVRQRHGVPDERISVVRNGPELHRFSAVAPHPSLTDPWRFVIGYIGEMGVQDGVDYLLRALKHLRDDVGISDFLCVLVGKGDAQPDLMRLAAELGLQDAVRFTGYIPHAEVMPYLAAADVCVDSAPSNAYNDRSTAIKLMEYMALSKPIVAFDLPEHRYTAQDAAVYARPNDELDYARKIAALLEDPVRCERLGRSGRLRVEQHLAWAHQESRLLDVYHQLGFVGLTNRQDSQLAGDGRGAAENVLAGGTSLRTARPSNPSLPAERSW